MARLFDSPECEVAAHPEDDWNARALAAMANMFMAEGYSEQVALTKARMILDDAVQWQPAK